MGFVYGSDGRRLEAEARAEAFIEFAHGDADNLTAVIVILVFCAKPKTFKEIFAHLRGLHASEQRISRALDFIRGQGLDVCRDMARIQAIPRPIDELIYRLDHDGRESPPPQPISEQQVEKARIVQAMIRVEEALEANGYRTSGRRRLRVVR